MRKERERKVRGAGATTKKKMGRDGCMEDKTMASVTHRRENIIYNEMLYICFIWTKYTSIHLSFVKTVVEWY